MTVFKASLRDKYIDLVVNLLYTIPTSQFINVMYICHICVFIYLTF